MSKEMTIRQEYRMQEWALRVEECRGSGLSIREYCEQQGLSEKTYYYWLRKLRRAAIEAAEPKLVELEPKQTMANPGTINVRYRGAELIITEDTTEALLSRVLRVLGELC